MGLRSRINNLLHSVKSKMTPRKTYVVFSDQQEADARKALKETPFNPARLKPRIVYIKRVDMSNPNTIRYNKESK